MSSILKNTNFYIQPSFSFSNRVYRVIWDVTYNLLFRFSPRPIPEWRSFILRIFGAKIGGKVQVYPKVKIWAPYNLEMEDYSRLANDVNCYNMAKVRIGKKVVVSQGAHLCTGTHDYTDPNFRLIAKPITIKKYSWIAAEAFIHPGITIEEGCVIGARSVVTKNMPAWTVCTGNPCVPIKLRILKQ